MSPIDNGSCADTAVNDVQSMNADGPMHDKYFGTYAVIDASSTLTRVLSSKSIDKFYGQKFMRLSSTYMKLLYGSPPPVADMTVASVNPTLFSAV